MIRLALLLALAGCASPPVLVPNGKGGLEMASVFYCAQHKSEPVCQR